MLQKKYLIRILLFIAFIFIAIDCVYAQRTFNCRLDKLDETSVRVSPDPSNITIGQRFDVSVFDARGRAVAGRDFAITSDNRFVGTGDLYFFIGDFDRGDPWTYLDGRPLEMEGNITISHKTCDHTHSFPFQIKQPYSFDNNLNSQGQNREFAVAKYKNTLDKNLYVVMDINQNQLYLLEAPLTIDGSGIRGADGANGSDGQRGRNGGGILLGGSGNQNGTDGTDGGNGEDGENGGNGGNITVHAPQNIINQVSVNVDGGRGGQGGSGGQGGRGGSAQRGGRDGRPGRDGRNGQHGQHGVRGSFSVVEDNNIHRHFENVRHPHFRIEDIEHERIFDQ